jgi:hypothetical protein
LRAGSLRRRRPDLFAFIGYLHLSLGPRSLLLSRALGGLVLLVLLTLLRLGLGLVLRAGPLLSLDALSARAGQFAVEPSGLTCDNVGLGGLLSPAYGGRDGEFRSGTGRWWSGRRGLGTRT